VQLQPGRARCLRRETPSSRSGRGRAACLRLRPQGRQKPPSPVHSAGIDNPTTLAPASCASGSLKARPRTPARICEPKRQGRRLLACSRISENSIPVSIFGTIPNDRRHLLGGGKASRDFQQLQSDHQRGSAPSERWRTKRFAAIYHVRSDAASIESRVHLIALEQSVRCLLQGSTNPRYSMISWSIPRAAIGLGRTPQCRTRCRAASDRGGRLGIGGVPDRSERRLLELKRAHKRLTTASRDSSAPGSGSLLFGKAVEARPRTVLAAMPRRIPQS
jgi:hypothetical protein